MKTYNSQESSQYVIQQLQDRNEAIRQRSHEEALELEYHKELESIGITIL